MTPAKQYYRKTYSLFFRWVSEYVEYSEHFSNNGTIAERVADGCEPSCHLHIKKITKHY